MVMSPEATVHPMEAASIAVLLMETNINIIVNMIIHLPIHFLSLLLFSIHNLNANGDSVASKHPYGPELLNVPVRMSLRLLFLIIPLNCRTPIEISYRHIDNRIRVIIDNMQKLSNFCFICELLQIDIPEILQDV